MKTLLLFVTLFVLQLAAQSQEYVGLKFKDLEHNNAKNPDKRYDMDSMIYAPSWCDSLRFRFFHAKVKENGAYGTGVFFNRYKDSVVVIQNYVYLIKYRKYMVEDSIRLSKKGFKIRVYQFDDKLCSLSIEQ